MKRSEKSVWMDELGDSLIAEISLWSADLTQLASEIERIERRVDVFHIDVSDGHFSPMLLFFPDFVNSIKKKTQIPLHIHLMVNDSILDEQIRQFIDSGADMISIHVENLNVTQRLSTIHESGIAAGLVLKIGTPVIALEPFVDQIQWVTILGTDIGVKGCELDPNGPKKIKKINEMLASKGLNDVVVAADGGIREHTVPLLHASGAKSIVMGSLAFSAEDFDARMDWLKGL